MGAQTFSTMAPTITLKQSTVLQLGELKSLLKVREFWLTTVLFCEGTTFVDPLTTPVPPTYLVGSTYGLASNYTNTSGREWDGQHR